jgi:hypothetical protein
MTGIGWVGIELMSGALGATGAEAASGAPQYPQNRLLVGSGLWHFGQAI